jgi:Family of unknown function (DUF6064)
MPEWWTYTLSDFLLFSPRTYYRMIERHNLAVWPGQIVTLLLGLVIAVLLRRPAPPGRVIATLMAALWAWVTWGFVWERYVTINWAARYLTVMLALEALLLAWIGVWGGRLRFRQPRGPLGAFGGALLVLCVAGYPMLAPLMGRGWTQAEIFGMQPDPTVVATLGILLPAQGMPRRVLSAVPTLWCLASGATLLAMGSPEAWILLPAAMLGGVTLIWPRQSQEPAP